MNSSHTQSSNKQDQTIDAALAALRQAAQPPDGIEQRVLQSLAERATKTPRKSWRMPWLVAPVGVCAALAILSIFTLRRSHPALSPVANNTPVSRDSASSGNVRPAEQLVASEVQNSPHRTPLAHRVAVVRRVSVAAHANLPLPPAPLTEQERLLLQIAVSGDPSQRAMLNPEVLARKESEDDAQFRSFFAKPSNVQTKNP